MDAASSSALLMADEGRHEGRGSEVGSLRAEALAVWRSGSTRGSAIWSDGSITPNLALLSPLL